MNDQLKKRLIGAIALVALVVIFLPMLLDKGEDERGLGPKAIPDSSLDKAGFDAKTLLLPSEAGKKPGQVQPMIEPPPVFVPPREQLTESLPDPVAQTKTPVPAKTTPTPPAKPAPVAKPAAPVQAVPAPAATSPTGETWAIQVVSLSDRAKADSLAKDLKGARMAAFVQEINAGGKTLYRVRIGPEKDRAKLESLLGSLSTRPSTAALRPQIVRHP